MKSLFKLKKKYLFIIFNLLFSLNIYSLDVNQRSGDRFDLYSEFLSTNELGTIGSTRVRYDLMTETDFKTYLGLSFEDQIGNFTKPIVEKTGGASIGINYQLNQFITSFLEVRRKFNKETNYDASLLGFYGGHFSSITQLFSGDVILDSYYEIISVPSISYNPVFLLNSKLGIRNELIPSNFLDLYTEIHFKHSPDDELGRSEEHFNAGIRSVSVFKKFVFSLQLYKVLYQTQNFQQQDLNSLRLLISIGGQF